MLLLKFVSIFIRTFSNDQNRIYIMIYLILKGAINEKFDLKNK